MSTLSYSTRRSAAYYPFVRDFEDDPTIPPPGKRSGTGVESVLPYLQRSLASKPNQQPEAVASRRAPEPQASQQRSSARHPA